MEKQEKRTKRTEQDILAEIEELKKSPYVKLGRATMKLKNQLYNLRHLEKLGRAVAEADEESSFEMDKDTLAKEVSKRVAGLAKDRKEKY